VLWRMIFTNRSRKSAQHSPASRDTLRARCLRRVLWQSPGIELRGHTCTARRPSGKQCGASVMVAVAAFSGSLRGLKLIPSKWRCRVRPRRIELVEITSPYHPCQCAPQGCYAIPRSDITQTVGLPLAQLEIDFQ
jgi:hypothetical protein